MAQSPEPKRSIFISSRLKWRSDNAGNSSGGGESGELAAIGDVLNELKRPGSQLHSVLSLIAEKVALITKAAAAAIALADEGRFVCRAAYGDMAPPLGSTLDISSGLSGECVRTRQMVRCNDSETDSRVNAEECRALGIRSIAAVPLEKGGKVVGLIEILSPCAHAFGEEDVATLRRMASVAIAAVDGQAKAPAGEAKAPEPEPEQSEPLLISGEVPPDSEEPKGFPTWQRALAITATALILGTAFFWSARGKLHRAGSPANDAIQVPPAVSSPDLANRSHLRVVAEAGDANAQFGLGSLYVRGEGVPEDYQEAAKWFALAAQQGNVAAQSMLGTLYLAGRGVPKDYVRAYMWSSLAADAGDEISKQRLAELTSSMPQDNVTEARRRVSEWLKTHAQPVQKASESNLKRTR